MTGCDSWKDRFFSMTAGQCPEGLQHLHDCPDCRREYEVYTQLRSALMAVPAPLDPQRKSASLAAIRRGIFRQRLQRFSAYTASAAAVLLLVLSLSFFAQKPSPAVAADDDDEYQWIILKSGFSMTAEDLPETAVLDYLSAAGDVPVPELLAAN